ncbi:hypothetical protein Tco_1555665 [Tanacetum coccineum]
MRKSKSEIVGQIMIDHALSYALTATVDVPAVYIQQFWKSVKQVPNANDTIHLTIDRETITYTMDMFHDTLKLPIVGYQGDVDKVSAFFTKNLAQPWKTMFKVFNRCLTSRTSGHDKTKINILEIFHVVINRVHVDYAALLWWDFLHCVQQKKDQIQYPHFTKLINADLMKKFSSIPQRLEEDYHFIKDDIPLVSVYTTGNVTVRGMLISDEFFTDDIRATKEVAARSYEVFVYVDAHNYSAGNCDTLIPPPSDDKERDEESYASEFVDSVFHDDDDSGNRIEPGSHNEHPEIVDDDDENKKEKKDNDKDDDVNDDYIDHTLDKTQEMGSLETRNEQTRTPILSPHRSPRTILSSDKNNFKEIDG